MKGLDLARNYYKAWQLELLAPYAAQRSRIAAGLVGHGSECFGFDDALSRDHDFGPGFCLWLTDADYAVIGPALQADYERLPKTFANFPARSDTARSGQRVGVFAISAFYSLFLGAPQLPISDADWLQIPEEFLATAVNGEVFADPLGEFSRIRAVLQNYYPDSLRRRKIASGVAKMAQSGQYNLPRALLRNEMPTALMAQAEFIKQTCCVVHALNRRYTPIYKWLHRGLQGMLVLGGLYDKIARLSQLPASEAPALVEEICVDVLRALIAEGLTQPGDAFLESHVDAIRRPVAS